jgi:DNA-binding PadR family transcriptional regulator
VRTRLLVLWLLAEGPLHGYRVRKVLADGGLRFWFPVEAASVYAVLRTLVRKGWARVAGTERAGARPARTVYAITPAGRAGYRALLRRALGSLRSPDDPVHVALAAEGDLEEAEVRALLRARAAALEERLRALVLLQRAAPSAAMVERERSLARAELRWVRRELRKRSAPRRKA